MKNSQSTVPPRPYPPRSQSRVSRNFYGIMFTRGCVYRLSLIQDERRKHLLRLLAGKRDLKQLVFQVETGI